MRTGTLELRSGRWEWELAGRGGRTEASSAGVRESAMGDAEPAPEDPAEDDPGLRLTLADPDDPRSQMSREVSAGTSMEDEDDLRRLAREPDERTVVDAEGELWRFVRVRRPPAAEVESGFDRPSRKVRFSKAAGAPEAVARLPEGRTLGEVTREELLDLVGG